MKRREPLSFDFTPLIDVVFILLIFFMVTSVFKKDELALVLDLPTSNASSKEVSKDEVSIELSSNSIAYKGKIVSLSQLENKLSLITQKDNSIIFRIDKKVPYEKVVEILDILQKYDLHNLALITDK